MEDSLLPHPKIIRFSLVDYFFFISEFLFGVATEETSLLYNFFPASQKVDAFEYTAPVATIFCLYATDSFIGKIPATYIFSALEAAIYVVTFVLYLTSSFTATWIIKTVKTFGTDTNRPIRWALMYSSRPSMPFAEMRRFVLVVESSYLLGKAFMKALLLIAPTPKNNRHIPIVLVILLLANTILFPVLLSLLYKRRINRPHFKYFAVENAMKDATAVVCSNMCKKFNNAKLRQRNQSIGVAFLVLLAIFIPFTVARLDNELIKSFAKAKKELLYGKTVKNTMSVLAPIITVLTLVIIEYGGTKLMKHLGWHPYYLTWMTSCFIVIYVALNMMMYLFIEVGRGMPFQGLSPGQAHMTIFNCLPASLEVEWASEGVVDLIGSRDYLRQLFIEVDTDQNTTEQVVLSNKPTGMYKKVNLTLKDRQENVFVVNYDGLTSANIEQQIIFEREANKLAELRVLDCFESCCRGNVTIIPEKPSKKQDAVNIKLSKQLLSNVHDFIKGTYIIAYHPDQNNTLNLGNLVLKEMAKKIVLLHSIQRPEVKVLRMKFVNHGSTWVYIIMSVLVAVFRISHPYQKMVVIYKTEPTIYTFVLGIHLALTRVASFGGEFFFAQQSLEPNDMFIASGLSGVGLILYLFLAFKLRKHFQVKPNVNINDSADPQDTMSRKHNNQEPTKMSKALSVNTAGTIDLSDSKIKKS